MAFAPGRKLSIPSIHASKTFHNQSLYTPLSSYLSNTRHIAQANVPHLLVFMSVNHFNSGIKVCQRFSHNGVLTAFCPAMNRFQNSILRICFLQPVPIATILVWVLPEADPVTNIQMQVVYLGNDPWKHPL